jgi:hypothetical protein
VQRFTCFQSMVCAEKCMKIRRTLIFRVDLLHTSDFIGSECRCESTTRNIQELKISGNKLRLALGTVSRWWSQTPAKAFRHRADQDAIGCPATRLFSSISSEQARPVVG